MALGYSLNPLSVTSSGRVYDCMLTSLHRAKYTSSLSGILEPIIQHGLFLATKPHNSTDIIHVIYNIAIARLIWSVLGVAKKGARLICC